eukprot:6200967-Pleurochrysis_carterae.AAC.1
MAVGRSLQLQQLLREILYLLHLHGCKAHHLDRFHRLSQRRLHRLRQRRHLRLRQRGLMRLGHTFLQRAARQAAHARARGRRGPMAVVNGLSSGLQRCGRLFAGSCAAHGASVDNEALTLRSGQCNRPRLGKLSLKSCKSTSRRCKRSQRNHRGQGGKDGGRGAPASL